MKLIEWSELSDGQRLTFGCDRGERRLDPVGEVRGAVVLAHLGGGIGHNVSPGTIVDGGGWSELGCDRIAGKRPIWLGRRTHQPIESDEVHDHQ